MTDYEEKMGMTYKEAEEYLKNHDKRINTKRYDGYTVVAYAKSLKNKEEK